MIGLPSGGPPSASTVFSTFSTRSSGPPKRAIPLTTSNVSTRTVSRSRWPSLDSRRTRSALTVEQNVLTLEGRKSEKEEKIYLHRGISARNVKRQFTLAEHVEVKGARFENGLLVIDLQREIPEAMKPRRIAISDVAPSNVTQVESRVA